jgi:hypothetical protein
VTITKGILPEIRAEGIGKPVNIPAGVLRSTFTGAASLGMADQAPKNDFASDPRFPGLLPSQIANFLASAGHDIGIESVLMPYANALTVAQLAEKKKSKELEDEIIRSAIEQQIEDLTKQIDERMAEAERRIALLRAQAAAAQKEANEAGDRMLENKNTRDEADGISSTFDRGRHRYRTREDRGRAEEFCRHRGRAVDASRSDADVQNNVTDIANGTLADDQKQAVLHQRAQDKANAETGAADDAQARLDKAKADVARIGANDNLTPEQRRGQLNTALGSLQPKEIFRVADQFEKDQRLKDQVEEIGINKDNAVRASEPPAPKGPKSANNMF